MNLGKLRRRLQVTGRGEQPAVVRQGDAEEFDAIEARAAHEVAPPVTDDQLPPLEIIDRDEPGPGTRP